MRRSQQASLRKIIPLGDRVLVKRVIAETRVSRSHYESPRHVALRHLQNYAHAQSAGGILLADTGKKLNEGEVSVLHVVSCHSESTLSLGALGCFGRPWRGEP